MKLTYARVTAALAIAITAAGGAAAAVRVPAKSVGRAQLADKSVRTKKLGLNSVERFRIKPGSLKARDVAAGQAQVGPRGPAGMTGARGPANRGELPLVKFVSSTSTLSSTGHSALTQSCGVDRMYGGGVSIGGVEQLDTTVVSSYPSSRGWQASVSSTAHPPRQATLTVICVTRR